MKNTTQCQCEPFQNCPLCSTPQFPKPGDKKKKKLKTKRIESHNIEPPFQKHCRRCSQTTGTEALRHIETFRKHQLGKGSGRKADDRAVAWLCMECDSVMSTKPDKSDLLATMTHAEEWLWLILKTRVFVQQ